MKRRSMIDEPEDSECSHAEALKRFKATFPVGACATFRCRECGATVRAYNGRPSVLTTGSQS